MLKIKTLLIALILTIAQGLHNIAFGAAPLPVVRALHGELRPRATFVQDVLGITEPEFALRPRAEQFALLHDVADSSFAWGKFTLLSLGDLKDSCAGSGAFPGGGSFHVLSGVDPLNNPRVLKQVDAGAIQAHWGLECQAAHKKLTVMVASNSNGLETVGYGDVPTDITRYINDPTQGPAASISAAMGTLWRNYFAFRSSPIWRQTADQQINFLDDLMKAVSEENEIDLVMSNGYLMLGDKNLPAIAKTISANRDLVKVGVHTDVTVSHGFRATRDTHHFLTDENQIPEINQVFCAGLDLGQGTNQNNASTRRIAQILLETQVEATLRAAYLNNTDIVVLCMLGCGAFGNDPAWLIGAIENCQKFIQASGMRVVLNLFDGKGVTGNEKLQTRLTALAGATGGKWLQYFQRADGALCVRNLCLI
jgi:hypothetical protein